ncbi:MULTISPECIES: ABC transporter ATP-binding protein [Clostridia]|uniref:ABC transporter ATP-binding protein n=1 Tax=Clostridia TaxID=186801 RepID=UPI00067F0DB8|nr:MULTISPECIES: ABC transporter ATP-binding protein [Clostridia]
MEIVKAAGLKKYYITDTYEVHALDGVTLSVRDGEFVAIVGTSGSGKTTLLNMLGGLDIPTEGGVWIRGNSLKDMEIEERTVFRRRNIGFVFQQYNLVPVLSVYENIVLPLRLDGAEIDYELLEEVTKLLGIHEKLERLPQTLSGGQQQRVAIARALLTKPAILLADEPTGNLDSVTSTEVVGLLKFCAEKYHQTVIVVTHQEEVAQMADRVIRMEDGRICSRTECAKDDGKACSRTEWEEYIQNSGTISGQEG